MTLAQTALSAVLIIQIGAAGVQPLPRGVTEVRPHLKKPFKTVPLIPEYRNEEIPKARGGPAIKGVPDGVKYITGSHERERYRLRFGSDGFIYDASGKKFDTSNAYRINERGEKTHPGLAMFIMDERGDFYASNFQQVGIFHHSSFVAGGPVAASGEMEVIGGRLRFINDRSGHYRVSPEISEQAVERLRQLLPRGTIEALEQDGKIQFLGKAL